MNVRIFHPACVAGVILLVGAFADVHAVEGGESDVMVMVSSQDAEGITQRSFDLPFLQAMEAYTLERTRIKANEYLASIGQRDQQAKLTSQATYVEMGTKKLSVIRITDQRGVGSVTIGGLVGPEFKRVVCAKNSPGVPPITFGPCGKKVAEVFSVKLPR